MRVAAGAIARKYLRERGWGLEIRGYLSQLGPIRLGRYGPGRGAREPVLLCGARSHRRARDIHGRACVPKVTRSAHGSACSRAALPVGLGEPVFDKLEADLARGLMSINAVKGVEVGAGFAAVEQRGSQHRDEMSASGFSKNDAGGTLGGISSGQDLLVSIALKPTSSVSVKGKTIDKRGKETDIVTKGRHDPCVGLRATPIAEAMVALVLMDHFLRNRAQNADVESETPEI